MLGIILLILLTHRHVQNNRRYRCGGSEPFGEQFGVTRIIKLECDCPDRPAVGKQRQKSGSIPVEVGVQLFEQPADMVMSVQNCKVVFYRFRHGRYIGGDIKGNDTALGEVFHNYRFECFNSVRRSQIQADHPRLIELLPAGGEVFRYVDRSGRRADAQQKVRRKIEVARSALQPAIFIGQFRLLSGEACRDGVSGLTILRHVVGYIEAQHCGLFTERCGKAVTNLLKLIDLNPEVLGYRFRRVGRIETAGGADVQLPRHRIGQLYHHGDFCFRHLVRDGDNVNVM